MKIVIESLYDWTDCETCGCSSAEGFYVKFEDGEAIDLRPMAHCYASESHTVEELITLILSKLGHDVEFVPPEPEEWDHEG